MSELKFFRSQKQSLRRLIAHYKAALNSKSVDGFRIKPASLLIGPSGTGKSFIAQALAANVKAPALYLSLGNWTPIGSKGAGDNNENSTAATILSFIDRHLPAIERGTPPVIFIDEADKFSTQENAGNSNWTNIVFNELLRMIDGKWKEFGIEANAMTMAYLKTCYFLSRARSKRPGAKTGSLDFVEQLEKNGLDWSDLQSTNAMPDELLNRIGSTIISIKPPGVDELSERIQNINGFHRVVMTQAAAEAEAKRILLSGQFIRGLESYFTSLAMRKYLSSAEEQPGPGYSREEFLGEEEDGFETLP